MTQLAIADITHVLTSSHAFGSSKTPLAAIADLPDVPSPVTTQAYMFIDTKKVVQDMQDLGFVVSGFRRPDYRTVSGAFSLHEVDFRLPKDLDRNAHEAPRILFLNSYDGSRKAQFVSGVIRFACSNGLIVGDIMQREKFIHLGDYEEQLMEHLRSSAEQTKKVFDSIERYRGLTLDRPVYNEMAKQAVRLRFPEVDGEVKLDVSPSTLLMPRRRQDNVSDLWTTWNRLQENLLKGGVPGVDTKGVSRIMSPLTHIERSNKLNVGLWNLLEEFATAA